MGKGSPTNTIRVVKRIKISSGLLSLIPYCLIFAILDYFQLDLSKKGKEDYSSEMWIKQFFGYFRRDTTRKLFCVFKSIKIVEKENLSEVKMCNRFPTQVKALDLSVYNVKPYAGPISKCSHLETLNLVTLNARKQLFKSIINHGKIKRLFFGAVELDLEELNEFLNKQGKPHERKRKVEKMHGVDGLQNLRLDYCSGIDDDYFKSCDFGKLDFSAVEKELTICKFECTCSYSDIFSSKVKLLKLNQLIFQNCKLDETAICYLSNKLQLGYLQIGDSILHNIKSLLNEKCFYNIKKMGIQNCEIESIQEVMSCTTDIVFQEFGDNLKGFSASYVNKEIVHSLNNIRSLVYIMLKYPKFNDELLNEMHIKHLVYVNFLSTKEENCDYTLSEKAVVDFLHRSGSILFFKTDLCEPGTKLQEMARKITARSLGMNIN